MAFSDYLEDKVLDHVFGGNAFAAPSTLYVALLLLLLLIPAVAPKFLVELTLSKLLLLMYLVQILPKLVNVASIEYPTATASYGAVLAVGVFDALTGGNLISLLNFNN